MAMYPCLLKPNLTFPTLTGSIVTFNSQYAGLPLKSHKIAITATQSGSGTPSPDNVRPISGWSALNITATGRNIFPTISTFPYTASGNIYFYDFAANGTARKIPTIHLQEGVEYTLSFDVTIDNEPFNISVGAGNGVYSRDIKTVTGLSSGRVSVTFTPTASNLQTGDILAFRCPRYGTAQLFNFTIDNVQLEYGGLTDYQPFGTYTTIQIGSTVYGGEYDARTGVLTVTHGFVLFSALSFTQQSETQVNLQKNSIQAATGLNPKRTNTADVICSIFDSEIGQTANAIRFNTDIPASDFTTTYGSQQLVFELETPTTIQLPPCLIDTLEGVNNIWADTGDTTLQYPKFG